MDYKFNAIVLEKKDAGETDRIYSVYTREKGRLNLLGRGVRKPAARLAGNLEPLTLAEIFVAKSRGRGSITGAIAVKSYGGIKKSWEKTERVFWALRIFEKLVVQEEKDEAVFELISQYLDSFEEIDWSKKGLERLDTVTLGFIFKLLETMGYGIEAGKCVICRKKLEAGENYFSGEKGGMICKICAEKELKKIKISDETVKMIRLFLANKVSNLVKIKASGGDLKNLKVVLIETLAWIGS